MGSSLVVRAFQDCSKEELKKLVDKQIAEDTYENGNSYSGYWTRRHLCFSKTGVFKDESTAENYIADNSEKWGDLMAVRCMAPKMGMERSDLLLDSSWSEMDKTITDLQKQIWDQDHEILKRVKSGKTEFRGCSGCGSKINVSHLHHVNCPVCRGNLLRTSTDDAQKLAWETKLVKLKEKQAEREEFLAKKKFGTQAAAEMWVVGAWCSS